MLCGTRRKTNGGGAGTVAGSWPAPTEEGKQLILKVHYQELAKKKNKVQISFCTSFSTLYVELIKICYTVTCY